MDLLEDFKSKNPRQYESVLLPLEDKLLGKKQFKAKEINLIHGKTQSGKTAITFLIAKLLSINNYATFIMTKKNTILRNQFLERAKLFNVDLEGYTSKSVLNVNKTYIYLYDENQNISQLNNFMAEAKEKGVKTVILYDEFHLICKDIHSYIENRGLSDRPSASDQLFVSLELSTLIFAITATPYCFRDANTLLKLNVNLYHLPEEPKEDSQIYIDLLDIKRQCYSDYSDIIGYKNLIYNDREQVRVILYYTSRFNEKQYSLETKLKAEYPDYQYYIINQDSKISIEECYKSFDVLKKGIIFIGNTCLLEGISFGLTEPLIIGNKIILGGTDLIIGSGTLLDANLENIVQIVGRITGYRPHDYNLDHVLWYPDDSNFREYFEEDGLLDEYYRKYQEYIDDPAFCLDKEVLHTLKVPMVTEIRPTRFYKSCINKVSMEICKYSLKHDDYLDTILHLESSHAKFPAHEMYLNERVTDLYSNPSLQKEFRDAHQKIFGIDENGYQSHIYPFYGGDRCRHLITNLVLNPFNENVKFKRDEQYRNTEAIIIPHFKFFDPCGYTLENVENIRWKDTIFLRVENHLDEDNPIGYIIVDKYLVIFKLKGQLTSQFSSSYIFEESEKSKQYMKDYIEKLPEKNINIRTFHNLLRSKIITKKLIEFNTALLKECQKKCDKTCIVHKWFKMNISLEEKINGAVKEINKKYF